VTLPPEVLDAALRRFTHDMRNPLLVLEGSVDIAQHRAHSEKSQEAFLERLRWVHADLCARLDAFSDNLRAVLAVRQPQPRPLRPGSLLKEMEQSMSVLFKMSEVALELPEGDTPTVLADEGALRRLAFNVPCRAVRLGRPGDRLSLSLQMEADVLRFHWTHQGAALEEAVLSAVKRKDVAALAQANEMELAGLVATFDTIAMTAGDATTLDVELPLHG
jgi:signal transduction histidine kinase